MKYNQYSLLKIIFPITFSYSIYLFKKTRYIWHKTICMLTECETFWKQIGSMLHISIYESLALYKINRILKLFMEKLHKTVENNSWNELETACKSSHQVQHISRRYTVSFLWFYTGLNSLSQIIRSENGHKFKSEITIIHLLYMDDNKL